MRKSVKATSDTIRIATSSLPYLEHGLEKLIYTCRNVHMYMVYIMSFTPDSVNGGGDWIYVPAALFLRN